MSTGPAAVASSPAGPVVRMGSGAASSAGRSRVRGRSRGVGGPPDAGGWSWSLVTRPVLCRFARDGMVVGMSSVIVIVSLVRCDPCRHPALSGFPCNPDGARGVPEMLPRPKVSCADRAGEVATHSVCSPPPCGEGLGVGVVVGRHTSRINNDPPPQPSPTRGEGADRNRGESKPTTAANVITCPAPRGRRRRGDGWRRARRCAPAPA